MWICVHTSECGKRQIRRVEEGWTLTEREREKRKVSWEYPIPAKKYRAFSLDDNGSSRNISSPFPKTRSSNG